MVIIGILKVYLNKLTTLSFKRESVKEKNIAQEGLICPRFGKVNAPWVMQCFCNRNTQILPKVGSPYYKGDQATCNTKEDKQ